MSTEVQKVQGTEVSSINDSATLMSVIARAASDPQVDVEKMERLWAMHERMEQRNAESAFNVAMNEAQAEIRRIAADAENKQTRSVYATYATLDRALRPIYIQHGFSLSFDTEKTDDKDELMVLCYVSHSSGHTRCYRAPMPRDGKGAKGNDVMTRTHATGSAMQYGMRYLLKMIFNVAIGSDPDDDDGNAASGELAVWVAKLNDCQNMDELKSCKSELQKEFGNHIPKHLFTAYNNVYRSLKDAA